MGKIAFVELLDRRGNIRERVRVDAFPATVGRSYANVVIVDDASVSAEHLRLSLDDEGGMIVEDLQSRNGTRLSASRERIERHRVPAGGEAVLRIGQTVLRLRGDDFDVGPATAARVLFGPFGRYLENRTIAFLLFAVGFGLYMLAFAQETYKKVIWSDLTETGLVLLIVSVLWTAFWSFINRLVAHAFRFPTHLGILGIASVAFLAIFTAVEYFEFLFTAQTPAEVAGLAGFGVIFALLIYGHLSILSESSRGKHMVSSVLASAAIVGMILLIDYTNKKEFSTELRFSSVIKPVARPWVRTVPPDRFFSDLEGLRARIGAMAEEGREGKAVKE